jgi:hypothetical protein
VSTYLPKPSLLNPKEEEAVVWTHSSISGDWDGRNVHKKIMSPRHRWFSYK